jgi:hypothetical protein
MDIVTSTQKVVAQRQLKTLREFSLEGKVRTRKE